MVGNLNGRTDFESPTIESTFVLDGVQSASYQMVSGTASLSKILAYLMSHHGLGRTFLIIKISTEHHCHCSISCVWTLCIGKLGDPKATSVQYLTGMFSCWSVAVRKQNHWLCQQIILRGRDIKMAAFSNVALCSLLHISSRLHGKNFTLAAVSDLSTTTSLRKCP